jgi:ribosomal protein S12 methylthiotransferase accessory factor
MTHDCDLLSLVSPRVGIIRELKPVVRGADEPNPPVLYHALLSNFDFRKGSTIERGAAGKGVTEVEARNGAIGEAVEHYCAAHINVAALHRTTLTAAPAGSVLPQDCVLHSEAQYSRPGFPYLRATGEMQVDWIRGRELPGNHAVWLPASLVYMHSNNVMPGDALCTSNSSGLAAGPTVAAAIRSALFELIERDAFIITWLNRLPAPEVDLTSAGATVRGIAAHYSRFGVDLRAFNLTTDIPVSVMMAVAHDRLGQGPAVVVGLGCHLDPAVALQRAAFEVCQVRPGEVHRYHRIGQASAPRTYSDVATIEDHSAFFWAPAQLKEMDFLLTGSRIQRLDALENSSTGSCERDVDLCVGALVKAGCRVAVAELTTPDLRDFQIHVVRAIATGLQPIHFGVGRERLGGTRLFEVPYRLGYSKACGTEGDLNPCPHPLA